MSALAACGPRLAPLPLDPDPAPPAPVQMHVTAAPAAPVDALTEEDLPEVAATPPPTPTSEPVASPDGNPLPAPAPGGDAAAPQISPATPSPLDAIGPGTPPNVAAATRLADAARARLAAGDAAAALEQLERAIAIDPNNPFAYFFLAQLHLQTRSYDQAIAFADRAAGLSTGRSPEWTSRAWSLQGNAYEAAGRFADARQAYLRAVRAAPNNLAALVGLARTGGATP